MVAADFGTGKGKLQLSQRKPTIMTPIWNVGDCLEQRISIS